MRRVNVRVCLAEGWELFDFLASEADIAACYCLDKRASRANYWSRISGLAIPNGKALIWEPGHASN